MFSSETIRSRDMSRISSGFNLSIPANMNNLKQVSSVHEGEFIGSDFFPNQQQQPMSSSCGLARYKSAPSSFLAALLDSNNTDNSSSGDESEAFFSALMTSGPTRDLNQTTTKTTSCNNNDGNNHHQYDMVKQEESSSSSEARPGQNGSVLSGQMGYDQGGGGGGCIVGSYSVGMESQAINNNIITSSLARQTTSRAGFFNGFGVMAKGAISSSDNNIGMIMSNHINFSSSSSSAAAPSSSTTLNITRFMPSIPENGNHQDIIIRTHNENNDWNDSPFSNNTTLKRNRDGEMRMFSDFNGLDNQNRNIGESTTRKSCSGLVHHLSLPNKTCTEMAQVEKLLQFQPPDLSTSVPCQVRAKRGFATHPRSIAERMRRTRISEKMKKLQDLFPNMDKQTSTADMLDLAVEYIKDLQKQVETLTETKAKCICSK